VIVELLVPWPNVEHDENLDWEQRLTLAISASRMLQFWENFEPLNGTKSPQFFWDLKSDNIATDLTKTRIKVVDLESFSDYLKVTDRHEVPST